jgi:hypothetical protein
MNKNIVRLPSKLYRHLFTEGGDKLIAVYCILKNSRENQDKYYAYKARNNRHVSGFSLLRSKTNLSLTVIKKYVPVLISMGLCCINEVGDVCVLGNNKSNALYGDKKIVPVRIGKNLTETSYNTMSVRLHSEERQQKYQIGNKTHRRDLIKQMDDPNSLKELQQARRIVKKHGSEIKITECVVLSNQGFAKLKDGTVNNKQKGAYWKKKLKQNGIVTSQRRFNRIKKMSFSEYRLYKQYAVCSPNTTYKYGWLVEETISSFSSVCLVSGEIK